ncbi:S41 family peptidase [uncultured Tyzzerella sp.]|uniref:S41 family peptidase n=1 Tax=uncultured Tyzzerella sp. TaxID=2321398 RepID=UPI002942F7DB|nr:S41 family peptidase [uncultured Tyzzerella sp.]
MNDNKKSFFMGVIFGMVVLFVINSFITNANLLYKRFILREMTTNQKISQIQDIVDTYYVNEYDKELMEETMYKGMIASLKDPYSYYMSEEELNLFLQDTEGNYVGIGIMVNLTEDEKILINKVFEGSPAQEIGLKVGDKIIKVKDKEVNLENYQSLVSDIKGEEGSKVKLTISREKENKTFDVDVTRRSLDVPTVEYKILEDNIGYISISQFDRVTYDQFKIAFDDLKNSNGLIIDLRNNPGGLLTTVNKITDMLVPEGTITYIEDKYGNRDYHKSDANAYNKPLTILVNKDSASASEVLSGAVKDFGVGKLVGETTYGKGVVQNMYTLPDNSGVKITMAKYYTPSGVCIQGTGIEPDYKVTNPLDNSRDLQLEKAIEVIKNWK